MSTNHKVSCRHLLTSECKYDIIFTKKDEQRRIFKSTAVIEEKIF